MAFLKCYSWNVILVRFTLVAGNNFKDKRLIDKPTVNDIEKFYSDRKVQEV